MFRFAAPTLPVTLRQMGLVAIACSVAALSACGGGNRAKDYHPDRIVSFGDENSAISSLDDDGYTGLLVKDIANTHINLRGLTYSVNNVAIDAAAISCSNNASALVECATASGTFNPPVTAIIWAVTNESSYPNIVTKIERDTGPVSQRTTNYFYYCNTNTLWNQVVAHNFNKGFTSKCPIDTAGGAETYATNGAKVADVAGQVNAHIGELGAGVLVTIMAGQNDILELFKAVQGGRTEDSATQELLGRATSLANIVRQIIRTGAKVVVAVTPDLGESPRAYALSPTDRGILKRMTTAFNERFYVSELGKTENGRDMQGVSTENYTTQTLRSSGVDYTNTACNMTGLTRPDGSVVVSGDPDYDARVKYCNGSTLNSTTTTYMWADDIHFTPYAHGLIGAVAYNRASDRF